MTLQVVGAGLPRTGTDSLRTALEQLLGGCCYHMRVIPGHPFDLGEDWDQAIAGESPDWEHVFEDFVATLDWPASMFWGELSELYPDALVLLSVRDSAQVWWESMNATVLPAARLALAPHWNQGHGLINLLERFTGTKQWDDPATLMAAYDLHIEAVRNSIPAERLLEWRASEGWEPICLTLDLPIPDMSFPWMNRREDWG